jgi:hypothetical protein
MKNKKTKNSKRLEAIKKAYLALKKLDNGRNSIAASIHDIYESEFDMDEWIRDDFITEDGRVVGKMMLKIEADSCFHLLVFYIKS